jgi:stage II sporulation protein D
VGRALGWNLVRSDAYELAVRNGTLVFDGHGHGHGVGLCQAGAKEMAVEGKSARDILEFYFPGTTVRITPSDEGWRETRLGVLRVRSAEELAPAQTAQLLRTWSEAQRLFVPARPVTPQIVIAPSTEIFRQLTGQPGWMLASTGGDTIVLQPETVLKKQDAEGTILHEMLHVLVEAEATSRAPLWLREGLVEFLASRATDSSPMGTGAIADGLTHAESLSISQRAHAAAAAKVKAFVARYGVPVVRGWLVSGVPAGAL